MIKTGMQIFILFEKTQFLFLKKKPSRLINSKGITNILVTLF